jgi:hypothetical protein
MTWYINIDDDLRRDQVVKFPFYRSIDADYSSEDLIFDSELYESSDKIAPRHLSSGDNSRTNCVLTADFRGVDRSTFKQKRDAKGQS